MGEQRDATADWLSLATAEDVVQIYRLLLRRQPENQVVVGNQGPSLADMIRMVVLSDEFQAVNIGPLNTDHVPGSTQETPPPDTVEWALGRLALTRTTQRKLRSSTNFLQAYHALLSDTVLRRAIGQEHTLFAPHLLARMAKASRVQALLDIPEGRTLSGWARLLDSPDEPMNVEIWVNDRFLGTVTTGHYRHDTAKRFGSAGQEGFRLNLPETIFGTARIRVRDAASRLILVDIMADFDLIDPRSVDLLRDELDQMRAAIEGMQKRLPERMQAAAYSLDRYGHYYETWLRNAVLAEEPAHDQRVLVILDAVDVSPAELEDAVWSLVAQRHEDFRVAVGLRQKDLAFLHDLMARVRWRRGMRIDPVIADDDLAWRSGIEATPDVAVVQLMRANGVLHPDTLRSMAEPFASDPHVAAVYCDEDRFAAEDLTDWSRRAHADPVLKPALDYDLLLQTPYVGDLVAFGRAAWVEAQTLRLAPADRAQSHLEAARQTLLSSLTGATVVHLPKILLTRATVHEPAQAHAWTRIVATHLGPKASVEPHSDVLGARVESASRIRWSLPDKATAAIIIPTRDRIDLLQPCVDSILSSLPANRTHARLHLIDHDSAEPETAAYLSSIALRDDVEVQPFSGAFNWALMNNLAAHALTDDVLIFLNNDTLVITAEWIDDLVALAMREDVGIVGCRLVYADGAIQHAGFLALDSQDHFLSHDGLGEAGSSAGYLGRNALTHRTVAVTGACMAVRRDVFRQLGGFDAARFPVEANDVDLCFKAAQVGLKVLYSPFPTLYHLESRSRTLETETDLRMSADARAQVWARWGDKVCPDPWYNPRFDRNARHFSRLAIGMSVPGTA